MTVTRSDVTTEKVWWSITTHEKKVRVVVKFPLQQIILDLDPDEAVAFGEQLQDEASIARDQS
jgi:hypothetical protein